AASPSATSGSLGCPISTTLGERWQRSPCSYAPFKTVVVLITADAMYAVHKKRAFLQYQYTPFGPWAHGSIILLINFRSALCHQTASGLHTPSFIVVAR